MKKILKNYINLIKQINGKCKIKKDPKILKIQKK